jgi:hypothetical protein
MTEKKDKESNGVSHETSRRAFLKYSGISMLGAASGFKISRCSPDTESDPDANNLFSSIDAERKYVGLDNEGSLVAVARINPTRSYAGEYRIGKDGKAITIKEGIAELFSRYIKANEEDQDIWDSIKKRIDYTYRGVDTALSAILGRVAESGDRETGGLTPSGEKIRQEVVEGGKKLLFKLNLVSPSVMDYQGNGDLSLNSHGMPGDGTTACTDWAFVAATMRWFHDNLDITYHQMAVGESSTLISTHASAIAQGLPTMTPEALVEGRLSNIDDLSAAPLFVGGYPFFYVRKYLQDCHDPSHADDPMQGHVQSISGEYTPPGKATDQLPFYNLSNAEAATPDARGRKIEVPNGANYNEIVVHKAVVGDPDDIDNYPGSVLINMPKLKIHSICIMTNAIKNIGIGMWPNTSGADANPSTTDNLYSYPSTLSAPDCTFESPIGNIKGRIYHSPHSHGIKLNCDGGIYSESIPSDSNDGIKGTMVDINLAINGEELVPYILHVSDAVGVTNVEHGGGTPGYLCNEGLVIASEDPVALDLFGARYLFKGVPEGTVDGHPFAIKTPAGDVLFFDNSIVSKRGGYEWPVEYTDLFSYAEEKGLGSRAYRVRGLDLTAKKKARLLVSRRGHFGRLILHRAKNAEKSLRNGNFSFKEILSRPLRGPGMLPHYASLTGLLWPMQNALGKLTRANDQLALTAFGIDTGYENRFRELFADGSDILKFGEEGSDVDNTLGIVGMTLYYAGLGRFERSNAHFLLKTHKYSTPEWNTLGAGVKFDSATLAASLSMALGPESEETVDRFFNMTYGTDSNRTTRWPSMQWTRFTSLLRDLVAAHEAAKTYAGAKGFTFELFVPESLPYLPPASEQPQFANIFRRYLLDEPNNLPEENIVETSDPDDLFCVAFFLEDSEVERW